MRKETLFLSALLSLIFASAAAGGDRVLPSGRVVSPNGDSAVQAAGLPTTCPSGGHKADGSDPEMQSLWNRIVTPNRACQSALVLCEPRRIMLKEGGDRLAEYMIRQYGTSLNQGCPDSTYLELIAATGNRGIQYLLEKAGRPGEPQAWLQGLLFANDLRAIDRAVEILNRNDMTQLNVLAISVVLMNMRTTGIIRSGDIEVLRRLERDSGVRGEASRALFNLEREGLTVNNQAHPRDLHVWWYPFPN